VWSKISNALKRLGFRSRNFLAQQVATGCPSPKLRDGAESADHPAEEMSE
jgi:hypothetical protein